MAKVGRGDYRICRCEVLLSLQVGRNGSGKAGSTMTQIWVSTFNPGNVPPARLSPLFLGHNFPCILWPHSDISHEIYFPTRENIDLPQMVVRILFIFTCWWFQSQYVSYSFHWCREDHKSSWFSHETFPVNHHYIIIIIMKQWDSKLPMVILKTVILTKNLFQL
jgi:hypothetical protein